MTGTFVNDAWRETMRSVMVLVGALVALSACGETRGQRVVTGAAGGVLAGEVIAGEPLAGAAAGGVIGAVR